MKKVLILTAGFGEGHNAAARNLQSALIMAQPDIEAVVVDIFDDAYGAFNRWSQRNYLLLINHAPGLWNFVFQWLDRTPVVAKRIGVFGRAAALLRKRILNDKPDVIVSTYPGYNHLLDFIHATEKSRSYTQVTIVTDSITINSVWLSGHSDWLLVANQRTAEVILKAGAKPSSVLDFGFPVPPSFVELRTKKSIPLPSEKWRVLLMVNSGKRTAVDVLRALAKIPNIELTITVGRDDKLQSRLQTAAVEAGMNVKIFGWTDQMASLIATHHVVITKAGGATVQECLAAGTPMILSQIIPGQEEGNAILVSEGGAGCIAETPDAIANAIRTMSQNDGVVWQKWEAAAHEIGSPNASNRIANWILSLPTS